MIVHNFFPGWFDPDSWRVSLKNWWGDKQEWISYEIECYTPPESSTRAYYSSHKHRSPISIHDCQYSSSARFLRKMRLVAIFTIDQQNQKLWCIDANNFCEVISHKEYHDTDRASIQCEPTKQPTEALESTIISHGMWGSHRFCPFWSDK